MANEDHCHQLSLYKLEKTDIVSSLTTGDKATLLIKQIVSI